MSKQKQLQQQHQKANQKQQMSKQCHTHWVQWHDDEDLTDYVHGLGVVPDL